ncbi:MAG: SOS response-associated peptidase [Acidimicrobiales bacterium]
MCGRFVSASSPDELAQYFGADIPGHAPGGNGSDLNGLVPNYNVAPTDPVPAVRAHDGHRELVGFRWGLVPYWAKDRRIGARMINARAETVFTKSAFRGAVERHRCLIPADGFYEWAEVPGHRTKQPYFIHHRDDEPLVFAGVWDRWRPRRDPDESAPVAGDEVVPAMLETCAVITCPANATMAPVHDRMPVLLTPDQWDHWITPTDDPRALADLLAPAPEGALVLRPVTTRVNNVRNNGVELLDPEPHPQQPGS